MNSETKNPTMRWADYEDEPDDKKYTLPPIPWAPHILPLTVKPIIDDNNMWITVKSKKKNNNKNNNKN